MADATHIRAKSSADVGTVLTAAGRDGTPVVPRSSTGPARIGRGAAGGDEILLDLSALDETVVVDRRNRVAMVEPGVTFDDLERRLEPEGLRVTHPLLPTPGKSVLAAFLDREPPLVPKYHWDMTDPLLCAELWFGTGDRFRTGGAAGPGDTLEEQWAAGMHQKNPLGPAQTDLLKVVQGSQGTMGVATWGSIRLEVRPQLTTDHAVCADEFGPVADFVHGVTRVRICDEILIFDAVALRALGQAVGSLIEPVAEWTALVRIGSLPFLPEESLEVQTHDAAAIATTAGVGLAAGSDTLPAGFLDGILGVTPGHRWKVPGTFRDVFFLSPLDTAPRLAAIARARWVGLGVDPATVGIYIQPLDQGRSCHVEITAFLDDSTTDLHAGLDADMPDLTRELAAAGAFFSRPAPAAASSVYARCPDSVRTLDLVKTILDPAGILAPGRLWTRSGK